jgi:hypothetical protein
MNCCDGCQAFPRLVDRYSTSDVAADKLVPADQCPDDVSAVSCANRIRIDGTIPLIPDPSYTVLVMSERCFRCFRLQSSTAMRTQC